MSGVATMPTRRFIADNGMGAAGHSGAHMGGDGTYAHDLRHQRVGRGSARITA